MRWFKYIILSYNKEVKLSLFSISSNCISEKYKGQNPEDYFYKVIL